MAGSLLMKLSSTRNHPIQTLLRGAQFAARVKTIAQKVKPPCRASNEALVRMHFQLQLLQHIVHDA